MIDRKTWPILEVVLEKRLEKNDPLVPVLFAAIKVEIADTLRSISTVNEFAGHLSPGFIGLLDGASLAPGSIDEMIEIITQLANLEQFSPLFAKQNVKDYEHVTQQQELIELFAYSLIKGTLAAQVPDTLKKLKGSIW